VRERIADQNLLDHCLSADTRSIEQGEWRRAIEIFVRQGPHIGGRGLAAPLEALDRHVLGARCIGCESRFIRAIDIGHRQLRQRLTVDD
jgi:hypothetical protein